mmetsp:Transcript_18229/g.53118  ORF Transcript_18229/g.53118 Transcript_18229/m.53118 type:complete len:309 (-) Transcript_18229:85-1011(-)
MATNGHKLTPLPVLFFAWYGASVLCTATSKVLVVQTFPSAYWLSFAQFVVASGVGYAATWIAEGSAPMAIPAGRTGRPMRRDLWALSLVFSFGMLALNRGYEQMHVSLVETLRATEPVVSALLAMVLLPADSPTARQAAALLPVVSGAVLSSLGAADFTARGLLWVTASNLCFCLRTIQYKEAKRKHGLSEWTLFYYVLRLGSCCQLLYALLGDPAGLHSLGEVVRPAALPLVLLNGLLYYIYLQCSWLVLVRVPVVTHAVANAMRRPVVLLGNVLYFRNEISPTNALGICTALGGVLLYTRARSPGR